jgi:hypothetical protein
VHDGPSHRDHSREAVGTRFPEVATVTGEDVTLFFFFLSFFLFLLVLEGIEDSFPNLATTEVVFFLLALDADHALC